MKILTTSITILLLFWNSLASDAHNSLQEDKNSYDILFYQLDLNVSDSSTYIAGAASIIVKSLIPSPEHIHLDFSVLLVTDSVWINGLPVSFIHASDVLQVNISNVVAVGDVVHVKVFYHGLGKNYETSGIYNRYSSSWNKHITWTLSEPFSAFNWFPCKQELTDKADSVYIFLSTDNDLKAGSNGLLTAEVPLPGNRVRYEWKSKFPIAYYLISFTISDYLDYSFYVKQPEGSDSILIQNYLYNDSNYLEQNKANVDKTADLIRLYSDLMGPYPFANEKYGHCVAPFSGGMEHQTMTTIVNFSFLLVAHELAHQWFGDYVTCSTWQDIWINEGFASYAEYLADQYLLSQSDADKWMNQCHDFVKSIPGGSVFVPENMEQNEGRIFDSRLTYKKGAAIIHMIRQEVGNDSIFFDVLTSFITKYKNGNVSGLDFRDHLEDKTGEDFTQFFDQWYIGEGYPRHSIRWEQRNDTLYISSLQTVSSTTPFFNVLLEFRVKRDDKDTLITFRQTANFNQWQMFMPEKVNSILPDPNQWLLIDLSDINVLPEPINDSGFMIIPNPASENITIELDNPIGKYSLVLTNAEGKIMLVRESTSQSEEIRVGPYPPGMYFIIIRSPRYSRHSKFVIN